MNFWCAHKWEVVSEQVLPRAMRRTAIMRPAGGTKLKGERGRDLFVKTYILILKCDKCGKLDKTITRS